MSRIQGVVTGIVIDQNDPESMGRVKLSFPWMSDSAPESAWARIAVPMAGAERGLQFMPEIDDEVLVAFENGDIRRPYVLGFLWNGEDAPPRSEPTQRAIQTVSGHVLEFDDTEGSERIAILFKGDFPGIEITQDAITIKFSDQSMIELSASELKIVNTTLVNINP